MKGLAHAPAYRWWLVGMLWLVCFFNYADRQAIFSVFPLLRTELHLSTVQLGVVGSSFMWMYALFGPVAGWLCDRMPRKALVLGGLVFWSVVTAATALAHTYSHLVICRALGGLGEAFYFPASMSLIADYHPSQTRSRAMALHQSSVYAGSIAGGAVSGYIGEMYGWRDSFTLFGGLGVLLALALFAFIREPRRGASDEVTTLESADSVQAVYQGKENHASLPRQIVSLLRQRLVLLLIAVFIGANFVAVVFLAWLPTYLFETFHMSLAKAGFSGTAYLQIASVLGVLVGGVLADRLVRRSAAWQRGGRMMAQALGLLCGVPFLFLTGHTRLVSVLLGALVSFGFFKGLYDANIWASLYDVVPLKLRGTAVGLMNSLGWLGGGTAPVVIAALSQRMSLGAAVSTTAVIYLLCGAALVTGARVAMRTFVPVPTL